MGDKKNKNVNKNTNVCIFLFGFNDFNDLLERLKKNEQKIVWTEVWPCNKAVTISILVPNFASVLTVTSAINT